MVVLSRRLVLPDYRLEFYGGVRAYRVVATGVVFGLVGIEITWQHLLYFSCVTLTSVGYGDITPAKFYAQSFAAFEAIIGVVFTAVLFSRLVGLYGSEK